MKREVEWWLTHRGNAKLFIAVTNGDIQWDATTGSFAPSTKCLPESVLGAFEEEPLWIDLREARKDWVLTLRHARFRDCVLSLAAPLHGRPKDALDSEDIQLQGRAKRLAGSAVAMLVGLSVVSIMLALAAREQRDRAEQTIDDARNSIFSC